MHLNKGRLYLAIYLLFALCLGFYWYSINISSLSNFEPVRRFIIRLLFGLGYLALAILYCKISQKPLYLQVVSQIYLLFETSILGLGLVRYFITDTPVITSLYSTLLGITVSPLGLLLTHVIISLNTKKAT
jgi:hypothetical protein